MTGNGPIVKLSTGENAGDVSAVLNRPLGKRQFILVPDPLDLCPEALEEHDNFMCVPRQIAALTQQDEAKVADQFDTICPGWRDEGISSNSILAYAKKYDYSAYCYFNNRLLESHKGSKRALCWVQEASHAMFYNRYKTFSKGAAHKSA